MNSFWRFKYLTVNASTGNSSLHQENNKRLTFLSIWTKLVIEKFKHWLRHIRMSFYPYLLLALSGSGMICNVMSLFIFAKQRFRRNFHRLLVILAIYDFLVRFIFFLTKTLFQNYLSCKLWADFNIQFTKTQKLQSKD